MSKVMELDIFTVHMENYMTLKPQMGNVNTSGMSYFNAPKVLRGTAKCCSPSKPSVAPTHCLCRLPRKHALYELDVSCICKGSMIFYYSNKAELKKWF